MPKGDNPRSHANLKKAITATRARSNKNLDLGRGWHPNNKGPDNLKAYTDKHGFLAPLKHGANSKTIRERYDDLTSPEGQRLKKIMDDVIESLGGLSEITVEQQIILGNLRSKLIVTLQINEYVSRQTSLVNKGGELLPCLKSGQFPSYTNAIEAALTALNKLKQSNHSRPVPDIEDIING